jgi:hypothetical protein
MVVEMIKTYSEVIRLSTFEERYDYLRTRSSIGEQTFGSDRQLNQMLYTSSRWRRIRDQIIIRDSGFDLAMPGYNIVDYPIIHHINPITLDDIENDNSIIYDPQNLICTSFDTHNAIHFGNGLKETKIITRTPNDTSPWLMKG